MSFYVSKIVKIKENREVHRLLIPNGILKWRKDRRLKAHMSIT